MASHGKAFSKADLLACILIIGLLAVVLFPAFGVGTQKSDLAFCADNLRKIWIGLESYGADYDDYSPPAMVGRSETLAQRNIMYFLWPNYVPDNHTFHCPADHAYWHEASGRQSYSYWFEFGIGRKKIHEPIIDVHIWGAHMDFFDLSKAVIMDDGEPWISRDCIYYGIPAGYTRHFESKIENCLYLDGHVATRDTHWPDLDPINYRVGPWTWKAR